MQRWGVPLVAASACAVVGIAGAWAYGSSRDAQIVLPAARAVQPDLDPALPVLAPASTTDSAGDPAMGTPVTTFVVTAAEPSESMPTDMAATPSMPRAAEEAPTEPPRHPVSDQGHPDKFDRLPRVTGNQNPYRIVINKAKNELYLYRNGEWVAETLVATGRTPDLTAEGTFAIIQKVVNPSWTDPITGTFVPGGTAQNPLQSRWMGLSLPGTNGWDTGLHGTVWPESMGKHASLGCIRMLNSEVEALFDLVPAGTPVTIVASLPDKLQPPPLSGALSPVHLAGPAPVQPQPAAASTVAPPAPDPAQTAPAPTPALPATTPAPPTTPAPGPAPAQSPTPLPFNTAPAASPIPPASAPAPPPAPNPAPPTRRH